MCSADVASALTMYLGVLDYTPALNANLNVDDTGNTFAGTSTANRVYIDPYSANNTALQYYVVGYKGSSPMTLVSSIAHTFLSKWFVSLVKLLQDSRLDFKTRYGIVANPFAEGAEQDLALSTNKKPLLQTRCCSRTSCDPFSRSSSRTLRRSFFLMSI